MTQFRWLLAGLIALAMPGTLTWGQSVTNNAHDAPLCNLNPAHTDDDATRAEKYLEMWQLLWKCELYHEAENLAVVAARSCPDSVELRHALFVSQLVNAEQPTTPEFSVPIAASTFEFSIPQLGGYQLDAGLEFGVETGSAAVVSSDNEEPKACVKGACKRRGFGRVKPACVKSCETMPCDGIVQCQAVDCGAIAGGLIGSSVGGAVTGNALGALVGSLAGCQAACCEAKSCCSEAKSRACCTKSCKEPCCCKPSACECCEGKNCAGCCKSGKDACCCKPDACKCAKSCSCGKEASCNARSCCTPPCCGTTNGCCAMGHKDEPFTIGRIVIVGNHITQDRVIRRVLDLYPGQVVKASELTRAEQSLARLGLFETSCGIHPTIIAVDCERTLASPFRISFSTKDLVVTVRECQTGSAMLGGCINSNNGTFGSVELNEKSYRCLADTKKSECACGKDCCCAKKCACGKNCACGGKTTAHCPWLDMLHRHPRAALRILHGPLMPPFVHGMLPPPPHFPVGMPMPSPVMPPLPVPHVPVGCMPMPAPVMPHVPVGMPMPCPAFPPQAMMPPCPAAAPFAAVVSPNGQFVRWQVPCPGMAEQCVPAPVSVPAVADFVAEQLPMPRQVEVIPGTVRTRNAIVSRPAAGQPMPPCPPLTPVLHHDIGLPPCANETPDHTVRFHALKNGIHVTNSQFDARCDHITMSGNYRIVLEGNVHVEIRRPHMPACIEAACVAVNLINGSFEVNPPHAVPMPTPVSVPGQPPVSPAMHDPYGMPTPPGCGTPCPEYKCEPFPPAPARGTSCPAYKPQPQAVPSAPSEQ